MKKLENKIMKEKEIDISIVIPLKNEEEVLDLCFTEVTKECKKLNKSFEIIFVDDGSTDNSLNILENIAKQNDFVKVISFSRNFGQRPALMAGFKKAKGKAVINMDCDLQDPVCLISMFVEKWEEGNDVVLFKRKERKGESFFKKLTSKIYYKVFKWLSKTNTPLDCGITRLLSRKVVDHILSMPEHNIYLAGMTEFVGFKQAIVEHDRFERKFGKTKYSFKSLIKLAINNIMPYSSTPINFIFVLSMFLGLLGCVGVLALTILSICSVVFSGVLWIVSTLLILGGITTMSIAIVGLYVFLTYTETLNRPRYIIAKTLNLGENDEQN